MRRSFGVLWMVSFCAGIAVCQSAPSVVTGTAAAQLSAAKEVVIPRDTRIALRFLEDVSSADRHQGDVIHLAVGSDVVVDGAVVITAGTKAVAKITRTYPRAPYRDGFVEFSDPVLTLRDGRHLRLSNETAGQRRKDHALEAGAVVLAPVSVAVYAAGLAISFPCNLIASLGTRAQPSQRGTYVAKDMVYSNWTEITRYTRERVRVQPFEY